MTTRQGRLLPRVTYSNIGEDFSGVHAVLDEVIPKVRSTRRTGASGGPGRGSPSLPTVRRGRIQIV